MAAQMEECPNNGTLKNNGKPIPVCSFLSREDNTEHIAFSRKHVKDACHLCPHCECRMKVRA